MRHPPVQPDAGAGLVSFAETELSFRIALTGSLLVTRHRALRARSNALACAVDIAESQLGDGVPRIGQRQQQLECRGVIAFLVRIKTAIQRRTGKLARTFRGGSASDFGFGARCCTSFFELHLRGGSLGRATVGCGLIRCRSFRGELVCGGLQRGGLFGRGLLGGSALGSHLVGGSLERGGLLRRSLVRRCFSVRCELIHRGFSLDGGLVGGSFFSGCPFGPRLRGCRSLRCRFVGGGLLRCRSLGRLLFRLSFFRRNFFRRSFFHRSPFDRGLLRRSSLSRGLLRGCFG